MENGPTAGTVVVVLGGGGAIVVVVGAFVVVVGVVVVVGIFVVVGVVMVPPGPVGAHATDSTPITAANTAVVTRLILALPAERTAKGAREARVQVRVRIINCLLVVGFRAARSGRLRVWFHPFDELGPRSRREVDDPDGGNQHGHNEENSPHRRFTRRRLCRAAGSIRPGRPLVAPTPPPERRGRAARSGRTHARCPGTRGR